MSTHEPLPGEDRRDVPVDADVNIRAVFGFGIALFVVAAVIHLLVWVLFGFFAGETATSTAAPPAITAAPDRVPPEPRLQTNPREDLRELRAHEDEVLNSYGWVDKNAGVARIPIDEAMKLTLQRGFPVTPARQGSNERR